MRWIFFSPIVFILFGGICFYIGIKLLGFIRYFYPKTKAVIFWLPFAFLSCLLILLITFRPHFRFLRQFSSLWITIFLYLSIFFALLVIVDIIKFVLRITQKLPAGFIAYSTGSALVLCLGLIIYGTSNAQLIENVNYNINVNRAERDLGFENMRIVLISDTHIGYSIGKRHIKRIVDEINRAQPDLVCITGDIFDGSIDSVKDLNDVIGELNRINASMGIFACLGNHDIHNRSTDRIVQILTESGITVLQDELFEISDGFFIIGRKDMRPIGIETPRKAAGQLIPAHNDNQNKFIIMMDHRPGQFSYMENLGVDIHLSGHTHKGQIFPGTLIARAMFKRAGGISYGYWQGTSMHAVVTSGAGFWGAPVRIGTNSEVAVIDINIVE